MTLENEVHLNEVWLYCHHLRISMNYYIIDVILENEVNDELTVLMSTIELTFLGSSKMESSNSLIPEVVRVVDIYIL